MILTPHAIVGAALTNMFPNEPILGFSLAFISHYVLDFLPHIDYDVKHFLHKEPKTIKSIFIDAKARFHFLLIVLDFSIALILCVMFFVRNEKSLFLTALGILGGLLPDFFQFLYHKNKKQPWVFLQKIHDKIHHLLDYKKNGFLGLLLELVIPALFLVIYYFVKNNLF